MYYIIEIAGQQFKFKQGEKKFVPHVEGKIGEIVEAGNVLLSFSDDSQITFHHDIPVKAALKIEKQIKGDKVIAFKMKRRKGFRKKKGHRTLYTQVSLETIK